MDSFSIIVDRRTLAITVFDLISVYISQAFQLKKIIFLFLYQNICCGYSKEPSQWDGSFEHP